jgi:serine/threonine-protein kinase
MLFGILALQMDFVSRDALLAAMNAWVLDKTRPLGQVLVEQQALRPEKRELLEALVRAHLEMHGDDPERSLAALGSTGQVGQGPQRIADPDLQASLARVLARPPDDPQATWSEAVGVPSAVGQRFRKLRPHARGGLGEVFVARDEELKREVALKEIQGHRADDPASRARFVLEAEVTGGLEHPGIVPVYGLGQYADGRPYYAMRFIKGDSLKDAAEAFHAADRPGRDPGERALALRRLLGWFVDVCNAVAYAHSRGVLHRDLKPGNVMLGKYGETLVVDWGLAKVVGHPDGTTGPTEGSLRPEAGSGATPTETGQALGTPAYMSPEQAAGRLDELGPASDVYSLGATLYCLLTGRPPYQGADHGALLRLVQKGEFPPPRQVKAGVPAPLEAVCLRALAPRPEGRYATPRELADEVERWLADEPVRAYREPLARQLGRWGRRHRTLVASAAVLLVTAVLGLAAGLVAVNAERQRTEAARAAEAKRRQQAREALDALSSEVIDDWLAKQPELTDQQRKFLERALTSYEEFAQDTGQGEQSRAGVAGAYQRVGNIHMRLGRLKEAEDSYRTCQEWYARLAADYPAAPDYRRGLGLTHYSLGNLFTKTGATGAAEEEYRAAIALQQRLANDDPPVAEYRHQLARSHAGLGTLFSGAGHALKAEGEFGAALILQQRLSQDCPSVAEYRRELGTSHINFGGLLERTGRTKEAEVEYRAGVELYQSLVRDFPPVADYQNGLANSHNHLGGLYSASRRAKEAEQEFRAAQDVCQRLTTDYRAVPEYWRQLAEIHNNLGILFMESGRPKEAEEEYRLATAVFQQLADDHKAVPYYRFVLAVSHFNMGFFFQQHGKADAAHSEYLQALPMFQALVADFRDVPDYHYLVGDTLDQLAELAQAQRDFAESRRLEEQAIPHHRAALQAYPADPRYRKGLRDSTRTLAAVLVAAGEHAEASAAADQLAQEPFEPTSDRYQAACVLAGCVPLAAKDAKLPEARRQELAREYADRSLAVLRQAVADGYKDAAQLRKEPALNPLRGRDQFKKLLAEVEKAPASPKPVDQPKP